MSHNPNPKNITNALWYFWGQLKLLEPTSELSGIYANKKGYHNTRRANLLSWPNNYSVRDAEDRSGPDDKAAALDWTFPSAQRSDYRLIMLYSARLLASGKDKNDPRLDGLREFYGQADKDTYVEGWDFRYDHPVTSDTSHLWHIHFSFDRATVESMDVVNRVLSVLRGETVASWRKRVGIFVPPAPKPTGVHKQGSRTLKFTSPMMTGDDVAFAQRWIGERWMGPEDGIAGPRFAIGVKRYQHMRGLPEDGILGKDTWHAMGVKTTY